MSISLATRPPALVARWLGLFEQRCRREGVRLTAQRRAVFKVLAEDLTHPTVEAIHSRLKVGLPGLPLATVYRILEDLTKAGLLRRVAAEGRPGRFDANLEEHQHTVCRVCGRMEDCSDPVLSALPVPRRLPAGFAAEALDVRITGLCGDCARRES